MPRFVGTGQGKGWAKGRSAATDPRIARNAESHRGRRYQRHLPPDHDRRYRGSGGVRTLPLEWSDTMAYVVGLMATDGCLIPKRRQLNFKSEDEQLVRTFLACLGRPLRYGTRTGRTGNLHYVTQFGDTAFYEWLEGVGLMPRKSLTLGGIDVPDQFLFPMLRGLFEGDGHISNFVHVPTRRKHPNYRYERLWLFFNSASRPHLEWIAQRVSSVAALTGRIEKRQPRAGERRHDFFRLKYGKHASIALLAAMYPNADVPKLERKWAIWNGYAQRYALRARRSVREEGFEPSRPCGHMALNHARLPITTLPRKTSIVASSVRS